MLTTRAWVPLGDQVSDIIFVVSHWLIVTGGGLLHHGRLHFSGKNYLGIVGNIITSYNKISEYYFTVFMKRSKVNPEEKILESLIFDSW